MNQPIKVEKTVTINKPAEELYSFWRNFENLPRFMKHLKSVKVYDDTRESSGHATRSHWITQGLLDESRSIEWDTVIIEDQENELISWASVESAVVENSGRVRFQPAPGNRGTEVKAVTEYKPLGGVIVVAIAKLLGEDPELQIKEDLRRFKMLMEAGEIATTEGQPRGRK
ncbi:MAG: SRPBCC family protein [Trichormus sp. ATA11-4-KO1]|nr:SRPBCC family protein [Trichormus sp. ATA11-4-KO1]